MLLECSQSQGSCGMCVAAEFTVIDYNVIKLRTDIKCFLSPLEILTISIDDSTEIRLLLK